MTAQQSCNFGSLLRVVVHSACHTSQLLAFDWMVCDGCRQWTLTALFRQSRAAVGGKLSLLHAPAVARSLIFSQDDGAGGSLVACDVS